MIVKSSRTFACIALILASPQARKDEARRLLCERVSRPVQARRELATVTRATLASSARQHQRQDTRQRRRSLDYGELYTIHNLPKLATPEWRTLV